MGDATFRTPPLSPRMPRAITNAWLKGSKLDSAYRGPSAVGLKMATWCPCTNAATPVPTMMSLTVHTHVHSSVVRGKVRLSSLIANINDSGFSLATAVGGPVAPVAPASRATGQDDADPFRERRPRWGRALGC